MLSQLRPALVSFVALTLITGVAYPLAVTAVAKVAFPQQAEGSLIVRDGQAVGSSLIGQNFTGPGYFWPRPSAAGSTGYDAASGSGSNLAPSNPALIEAVKARVAALRAADTGNDRPVPVDLVTASGSGLDPHISVEAAEYQLARVARSRGVALAEMRRLLDANTEGRVLGLLGEPRVNVFRLNLAMDAAWPRAARQ
jgi:K+-transporting ATPase ATPase C chain